jgi:hypothetical protein
VKVATHLEPARLFDPAEPRRKDDSIGTLQSASVVDSDTRGPADRRGQPLCRLLVGAPEFQGLATGCKLTRDG